MMRTVAAMDSASECAEIDVRPGYHPLAEQASLIRTGSSRFGLSGVARFFVSAYSLSPHFALTIPTTCHATCGALWRSPSLRTARSSSTCDGPYASGENRLAALRDRRKSCGFFRRVAYDDAEGGGDVVGQDTSARSREEKELLVVALVELGVSVSEVARSPGIHVSQIFQ